MCKVLSGFGFLVVAFLLMCTPSWATCDSRVGTDPASITCHYTAAVTSNTYDFLGPTSDTLRIEFGAVLRNFDLTMTRKYISTADFQARLSSKVFPAGSTCYMYNGAPFDRPCTVYDATLPLPIKGTDYLGPVTWEITYSFFNTGGKPAMGHAAGTSSTFSEDILVFYDFISGDDDASMGGMSGGLSGVAAVKEPAGNNCFSWVSPVPDFQTFSVGTEIQVEFKLFPSSTCGTGTPIRDHDARMFVARIVNGKPVFIDLGEGKKHFNFDPQEGVNEQVFDTDGQPTGEYRITVISDEFGQRNRTVFLQ